MKKILLSLMVGVALVGCGGGSSSSEGDTTNPLPEENTVLLTTVKGSAQELYGEGHELVARKMQKSYKQLAMSVFIPSGTEDPIPEEDGVVKDEYAVRLTPEDDTLDGFIMRKCSVEVEEEWSSAKGKMLKYIFSSLKPKTGKMIEKYKKAESLSVG